MVGLSNKEKESSGKKKTHTKYTHTKEKTEKKQKVSYRMNMFIT